MVLRFQIVAVAAVACPLAFKILLWLQWRGPSLSNVAWLQWRAPSLSKCGCGCSCVVLRFQNVAVVVVARTLPFKMLLWLQWGGPSLSKCSCCNNGVPPRFQNVAVAAMAWTFAFKCSLAAVACPLAFKMWLWLQLRGPSVSKCSCGCSGVPPRFRHVAVAAMAWSFAFKI